MDIQDQILKLLGSIREGGKSVAAAGDRATMEGRSGQSLYDDLSKYLSDEELAAVTMDLDSLRGPMGEMPSDPLGQSQMNDIIRNYMGMAQDMGVSPEISGDNPLLDDMFGISAPPKLTAPATAPRVTVDTQPLPDLPPPPTADELWERDGGMKALDEEMGFENRPDKQEALLKAGNVSTSLEGGAIPLQDWQMKNNEPMPGTDQVLLAGAFLPLGALAGLAVKLGMRMAQAQKLAGSAKGRKALVEIVQKSKLPEAKQITYQPGPSSSYVNPANRVGADAARRTAAQREAVKRTRIDPQSGEVINVPPTSLQRMGSQAERGGVPIGSYSGGGGLQDSILSTYNNLNRR